MQWIEKNIDRFTRSICCSSLDTIVCHQNTNNDFLENLRQTVENASNPRAYSRGKSVRWRGEWSRVTSVICSVSARSSRASQSARRTVTFSKMAISCQLLVLIESSEIVVNVDGVELTMVRSHRFKTLLNIINMLFELERATNDSSNVVFSLVYLTCKRVNPERSEMRSSWRNGWISLGLSDRSASSNSSGWKSNNWKTSQKTRANKEI